MKSCDWHLCAGLCLLALAAGGIAASLWHDREPIAVECSLSKPPSCAPAASLSMDEIIQLEGAAEQVLGLYQECAARWEEER